MGEGWMAFGLADANWYTRMDKQQYGPNVEHRELYSESCNKS